MGLRWWGGGARAGAGERARVSLTPEGGTQVYASKPSERAGSLRVFAVDVLNKEAALALVKRVSELLVVPQLWLVLRKYSNAAVRLLAARLPGLCFFTQLECIAFADGVPGHLDAPIRVADASDRAAARTATGRDPPAYPIIFASDLMVRALGGRPGDVLAIYDAAPEIGGYVTCYRFVARAPPLARGGGRDGVREGGGSALAIVAAAALVAASAVAAAEPPVDEEDESDDSASTDGGGGGGGDDARGGVGDDDSGGSSGGSEPPAFVSDDEEVEGRY